MIISLPSNKSLRQRLKQLKQIWLRPLIIIGVLLFGAALPFVAPQRYLVLLVSLFPALGLMWIVLRWPPLGLLILIIVSLTGRIFGFLPLPVNVSMVWTALLIGLWVLSMVVNEGEFRLMHSRALRPLLFFMAAAIISFLVGQLSWFNLAEAAPLGAQIAGLALFLLSAGAFILVAHQIRDLCWLERMTWVFIILAGVIMLARVFKFKFLTTTFVPSGLGGSLFFTWFVAMAFGQAVTNRRLPMVWRLLLGFLVLLVMYDGYFVNGNWKSGWLPPMVGIFTILVVRLRWAGLLLILLGALLVPDLATGLITTDEYSFSTRIDAWLIMYEIIKAGPILGLGFGNYYWYTPIFRIRGFGVNFNSHNNYVDIVAQTGVVGLACFLWFAWEAGWLAHRLLTRVPEGFAQAYVYGALGGLVGTLVAGTFGDWVLPFFYNVGMAGFHASVLGWLFLGGLVALELMYGRDKLIPQDEVLASS